MNHYCALQVSCPVERVIGSGSQVLNSVVLQVTRAVNLYSDRLETGAIP